MLQHIAQVLLFGPSAVALGLILFLDFALTLVHSVQELKGHLWRYFGAIAGVWIPDVLGFLLFVVVLTLVLWTVSWVGIAGYVPGIGQSEWLAMCALGALIGSRLSDRRYSHVLLDHRGYRPNPGLQSARYFLAEAVLLAIVFAPGLIRHYFAAIFGFVAGWTFFFAVLPITRGFRIVPGLRRDAWAAGSASPGWARLP